MIKHYKVSNIYIYSTWLTIALQDHCVIHWSWLAQSAVTEQAWSCLSEGSLYSIKTQNCFMSKQRMSGVPPACTFSYLYSPWQISPSMLKHFEHHILAQYLWNMVVFFYRLLIENVQLLACIQGPWLCLVYGYQALNSHIMHCIKPVLNLHFLPLYESQAKISRVLALPYFAGYVTWNTGNQRMDPWYRGLAQLKHEWSV